MDKDERVIIQRGKDKTYELIQNIRNDRFFEDPTIQERLKNSNLSLKPQIYPVGPSKTILVGILSPTRW